MTINEKKSKVMIFAKRKQNKPPSFTINSKELDQVSEYTYLGVKISATGNFALHLKQIREKALYAFFKISRRIDFRKLKPKHANRLFDSYVLPILTYGSDIWSLYSNQTLQKWDNCEIEKVHLRFCRHYLGVNNKSSNIACRAEIGRFPLKLFINRLTIKYFNHLITLPDESLAKQSLILSNNLYMKNKSCYILNMKNMIRIYNPTQKLNIDTIINNMTIDDLESKMKTHYFKYWNNILDNSPKLSFYKTFKQFYEEEKYLSILNDFQERQHFTKLRISNHKLAIETGRYNKPKTPQHQRLCVLCNNFKIETEEHMISDCEAYAQFRLEFQSKISDKIDFSKQNYISKLMKSTDDKTIFYLSKFINKCLNYRKDKTSEV